MLFFPAICPFPGSCISADGVHVNPRKIAIIADWPRAKNISEVRSFLSLGNYFKRFIQGYAKLTALLVTLTSIRVQFVWGKRQHKTFNSGVCLMLLSLASLNLMQPVK